MSEQLTEKQKKDLLKTVQFLQENTSDATDNSVYVDSDNFFRDALNNLMSVDVDMSTKTEFMELKDVFNHSKMELYSLVSGVPLYGNIMRIIEKKMVSRERLGRREITEALKSRRDELRDFMDKMERKKAMKEVEGI